MKAAVLSLLLVWLFAGKLPAAVTTGSSRAEVIAAYGQPKGATQAGSREILVYADGRVFLENGLVARIDMKTDAVSEPPSGTAKAGPSAPPVSASPPVAAARPKVAVPAPVDWQTDFEAAKAEATAKKKRILALFTGSDWCPACMDFESQVAHDADFLRFVRISFVLVKLDYPQATPQPPALKAQNEALRLRYGVSAYPTLWVIGADGKASRRVDTRKGRAADGIVDYYIQAVDEARKDFDKGKSSWRWWPF